MGIAGIEMYLHVRTVDDAMRNAVRAQLMEDYSGRGRKDVARIVQEARDGAPVEAVQPLVQRDVEFSTIAARGTMGGVRVLVRAEITVDGGAPPDGREVRYLRVSRGLDGVWIVDGDSDSYSYFMELWH